jgi:hypothetical protein
MPFEVSGATVEVLAKNARRETGTPGVRIYLDNFPP